MLVGAVDAARDLDGPVLPEGPAGEADDHVALRALQQRCLLGGGDTGRERVLGPGGAAPSRGQLVVEAVGEVGAPPQAAAAIDLGTTVLPVLAKTYWKPLAGASLVVVLLVRWLRRR